jgi:CheY-like chemotaxis protein
MPGMSGWEVAEAVRSASPGAPVIVVTGSASDLDMERAGDLGVTILHKPVPLRELRTAIRRALAGSNRRG